MHPSVAWASASGASYRKADSAAALAFAIGGPGSVNSNVARTRWQSAMPAKAIVNAESTAWACRK